jgi:uncharacterized iron-regulated membrane protein
MHLWTGIVLGIYLFLMSVSGSVLVYANELYVAATPEHDTGRVPVGIRAVSRLIDLHDNLAGGVTGRRINGMGAYALLVLAATGFAIWWPGTVKLRRRTVREYHLVIGFWSLAFIVIFGLSGAYLANPQPVMDFADRIDPPTAANAGVRLVDQVIYWLAFLHFGRINGIGIPCHGPGVCDQATKFVWAAFGMSPAVMFVTGAMMWWRRVVRPRMKKK